MRSIDMISTSSAPLSRRCVLSVALSPLATRAAPDPAIQEATAALEAAIPRARLDPARPAFHFRPPAQWMNDPTGTIFHMGWLHLFYQLNPYGDSWGITGTCWGHARTRDLMHWEHQPIALHPARELGERRCNSGSITRNSEGRPVIFYTHVPFDATTHRREQWAVFGDHDLVRWTRHSGNPIVNPEDGMKGPPRKCSWGDPFVFRAGGRVFLTGKSKGMGGLPVFEAANRQLTRWRYRGILTEHTGECPNFFPLGDRWVLLVAVRPMRYYVGAFDLETLRFRAETEGVLDHSYVPPSSEFDRRGFYATTVTFDPRGRCVLWGWVSGFPRGRGWNGCLGLPRVLSLDGAGRLVQTPAPEFAALRQARTAMGAQPLAGTLSLDHRPGDLLELRVSLALERATRAGVRLLAGGTSVAEVQFDGRQLDVNGTRLGLAPAGPLDLRIFLDKSLLEVFAAGGREAVTRVVDYLGSEVRAELFSEGGPARLVSAEVWNLKPAWPE